MRAWIAGSLLLLASSGSVLADSTTSFLIERGAKSNFRPDAAGVLFQQGDVRVLKPLGAKYADFKNVYWVNFEGLIKSPEEFRDFGNILHYEDGKFALMRIADEKKVFKLSASLHAQGMACGALVGIKGDLQQELRTEAPTPLHDVSSKLELVSSAQALVRADAIEATVTKLSNINTRHHRSETGIKVTDDIADMYRALAGNRDDVEITTFKHQSTPQSSLLVRIKGSSKPDEIVVLGSHIDSITYDWSSTRSPGADDNASGTATNFEIFRVLMEKGIRPQRTIEIHGYAAEEIGLVGSQEMAARYKADGKNVVAMVQHDMNLYCATPTDKIWFVSNNTSEGLNAQLESLLKLYQNVEFGSAPLTAGNSDHYSWTRKGYHAAFPFENPSAYNSHIHTADDTIENSGRFSQAAEFAKLGTAYAIHFAGF